MAPSMSGWWTCCRCGNTVNSSWYGNSCVCSHEQCWDCKTPPSRELRPVHDDRILDEIERELAIFHATSSSLSHNYGSLPISSMQSSSNIRGSQGADDQFAMVIFQDEVLQPLWYQIKKIPIGRLESNLRRLIILMAKDLKEEATSVKDRQIARFVKSKADYVSSAICDRVALASQTLDSKDKEVDISDYSDFWDDDIENGEENEEDNGDEELMHEFQIFITNSRAYEKFRVNVKSFIGQAHADRDESKQMDKDLVSALRINEPNSSLASPEIPIRPGWHQKVRKYMKRMWTSFIESEKEKPGTIRITWTCSCGVNLYDDYKELEEGAAKQLEKQLRAMQRPEIIRQKLGAGQILGHAKNSLKYLGVGISNLVSVPFRIVTRRRQEQGLPSYEMQEQATPADMEAPRATERLFLLLCVGRNTAKSVVRAYQPPVHDVDLDRELFRRLRQYHTSIRKCRWSWLSLWELQHIHFVGFDLYERSLADIREVDAVPPQEFRADYRFEPSKVKPPIGSNLLMHYLRCPEEASENCTAPCLRKIPKKVKDELTVCPIQGVSPGWGLHFEEGWSWKKILTALCFLFIFASILEGVLYWKFQHSVQDSMALGTFILACFSLVVATLQAWLMIA